MNAPRRNPALTATLVDAFATAAATTPEGSEATEATAKALEEHLLEQGLTTAEDGAVTFEYYPGTDQCTELVAVIAENGHGLHLTLAGHVYDRF